MSIAKRAWNEALHPRDDDGRFTHKGGGTSGAPSTPTMPARQVPDISRMADNAIRRAAGRGGVSRRPERGMPDAIASIPVKTKSGAFSTNVGRVRVEMSGWRGPNDFLRITPAEGDDWGLVIAGPAHSAWGDATSNAKEVLQWV